LKTSLDDFAIVEDSLEVLHHRRPSSCLYSAFCRAFRLQASYCSQKISPDRRSCYVLRLRRRLEEKFPCCLLYCQCWIAALLSAAVIHVSSSRRGWLRLLKT